VRVPYPTEAEEHSILTRTTGVGDDDVPQVIGASEVMALRKLVRQVYMGEDVLGWIVRLVRGTRPQTGAPAELAQWLRWGAGPRAGQALVLAAKARALLHGRLAATREDVQALTAPVLRHRLVLSFTAEADRRGPDDVIDALLRAIPFAR
jgi:MoxR-like ATPase